MTYGGEHYGSPISRLESELDKYTARKAKLTEKEKGYANGIVKALCILKCYTAKQCLEESKGRVSK